MTANHNVKDEVRKYLIVFAALGFLTVVTVAISYLHLPVTGAVVLALFVAIIKASLVACYFMHLIDEKKTIYFLMGFTVFFVSGLFLVPVMNLSVIDGMQIPKGGMPTLTAHHEAGPHPAPSEEPVQSSGGH